MINYFKEDKIIFRKADDFHTHPSGVHEATVAELSVEDGQYGLSTRFVFDTGLGQIWAFASGTGLKSKNKLGRWLGAIFNVPVADLVEVDSSDVIGRSCRIEVGLNEKGDTRVLSVMPTAVASGGTEDLDSEQGQVPF